MSLSGGIRLTRPTFRHAALSIVLLLVLASLPAQAVPGQWQVVGFLWEPAPEGAPGPDGLPNVAALHAGVATGSTLGYAYASLDAPDGYRLARVHQLSLDVLFDGAGGCGGGSPRAQVGVDTDGDGTRDANIFVYAGDATLRPGCLPTGEWVHANLLDGVKRWDSSQLGGPNMGSRADALAAAGPSAVVTSVTFVYDSWWLFGSDASVWLDNLVVGDYSLAEPAVSDACGTLTARGFDC